MGCKSSKTPPAAPKTLLQDSQDDEGKQLSDYGKLVATCELADLRVAMDSLSGESRTKIEEVLCSLEGKVGVEERNIANPSDLNATSTDLELKQETKEEPVEIVQEPIIADPTDLNATTTDLKTNPGDKRRASIIIDTSTAKTEGWCCCK